MDTAEPDLFESQGFRQFLSEWTVWKKRSARSFSLRQFAARAGFSSHAFLPKVLDGSRNLTEESAEQVATAIGFKPAQARFFRLLVRHDQAETPGERDQLRARLDSLRRVHHRRRLGHAHAAYYEHWYLPALRHLAPTAAWGADPARLGALLVPPVPAADVRKGLQILCDLGLLSRDGTRYLPTDTMVSVDSLPRAARAQGRHDILQKGIESLHRFDPEDRLARCVLLGLSEDGLREVREILDDAARRCLEVAARDEDPVRICQAVVQMFPLTRRLSP